MGCNSKHIRRTSLVGLFSMPMARTYAEIVADEIRAAEFTVGDVAHLDGANRVMYAANA